MRSTSRIWKKIALSVTAAFAAASVWAARVSVSVGNGGGTATSGSFEYGSTALKFNKAEIPSWISQIVLNSGNGNKVIFNSGTSGTTTLTTFGASSFTVTVSANTGSARSWVWNAKDSSGNVVHSLTVTQDGNSWSTGSVSFGFPSAAFMRNEGWSTGVCIYDPATASSDVWAYEPLTVYQSGSTVEFKFIYGNDGTSTLPPMPFKAEVLDDAFGIQVCHSETTVQQTLDPNKVKCSHGWSWPQLNRLPAGKYRFRITLDPDGTLDDDDRSNNSAVFHFEVRDSMGPAYVNGLLIENNVVTGWDGRTKDIVIPEGVTGIASGVFEATDITSVSIPSTVSKIEGCFENCASLRSVVLKDGLREIGGDTFCGCDALSSVSLPSTLRTIGIRAFEGCPLTSVLIPDSVTVIDFYAFGQCKSLRTVKLGSSVETIGVSAFRETAISEIEIPASVREMGPAWGTYQHGPFWGCASLKKVTFLGNAPKLVTDTLYHDTSSSLVTYVKYGSTGWNGTAGSAYVPTSWPVTGGSDARKLEVYGAPAGQFTIEGSVLTAWNGTGTDLVIPEGVTEIADEVFYLAKITSVKLPDSLRKIGKNSFGICTKLTSVTWGRGLREIGGCAFFAVPFVTLTLPEGLERIEFSAFCDNESLQEVTVPESVKFVGWSAFGDCPNLRKVAFLGDEPELGVHDNETGREALYVNSDSAELTTYYKQGKRGWQTTMWPAGCVDAHPLKAIGAPEGPFTITNGVLTAWNGTGRDIVIPDGVTEIADNVFYLSDITSVKFPDSLRKIGEDAFGICQSLSRITWGRGLREIGGLAFAYTALSGQLDIPAGVETIDYAAFQGCDGLTSVQFPASVRYLGWAVFLDCSNLDCVTFLGDEPEVDTYEHDGRVEGIYCGDVPQGLVTYAPEGARGWSGKTWPAGVDDARKLVIGDGSVTTYTVRYHGNGGIGAMQDEYWEEGYGYLSDCAFTRDGYAFTGWALSAGGSVEYTQHQYCRFEPDEELDLYAVWKPSRATGLVIENNVVVGWTKPKSGETDVIVPEGIVGIASSAFISSDLTSITLPKSLQYIEPYAIDHAVSLTNVTFSANSLTKIDSWVVFDCPKVRCLVVPEGVRSIEFGAFMSSGIVTLVLPSTLEYLGAQIVLDSSLKEVFFRGNAPRLPTIENPQYPEESSPYCWTSENLVSYVREGSTGWKDATSALPALWPSVEGRAIRHGEYGGGSGGDTPVTPDPPGPIDPQDPDDPPEQPEPTALMVGRICELDPYEICDELELEYDDIAECKFKGLPKGLKFDAREGTITGVPSQAGTYAVTVTAGNQSKTVEIVVEALPEWAIGNFNGYVRYSGEDGGDLYAAAKLTVGKGGKVSGSFVFGGKKWTLSAAGYEPADEYGSYEESSLLIVAEAKSGKETMDLELLVGGLTEDGVSSATATCGDISLDEFTGTLQMWRDIWKDKGAAKLAGELEGVYTVRLDPEDSDCGYGFISLTVNKKGVVKATGKLPDGMKVSGSLPLMYTDGEFSALLSVAPSAYNGGSVFSRLIFDGTGEDTEISGDVAWVSLNPKSTGNPEDNGFNRALGATGGWYNKLANLNEYYSSLTLTVTCPSLVAQVRHEYADKTEILNEEIDSVEVSGVTLELDEKGVKFVPPKATKPYLEDGEWMYEGENDAALSFAFTKATGLFKGTFTCWYDYHSTVDEESGIGGVGKPTHVSKKYAFEGIATPFDAGMKGFFTTDATAKQNVIDKRGNMKTTTYTYKVSHPIEF